LQIEAGHFELGLVGRRRGHDEVDAARAGSNLGADLQQLQADGVDSGVLIDLVLSF